MKRIFLISSIITVTCTGAFAQSQATAHANTSTNVAVQGTGQTPAQFKSDLTARVGELTTLLNQNNAEQANVKWMTVHQMLMGELHNSKMKVVNSPDDATKNANTALVQKQTSIYGDLIKLKSDLIANKASIILKLNEFLSTMN